MAPRYGPPDASLAPRYTGVRSFARLPHVTDPEGVDAAVVGVPFDTATSFRPGARFGPEGIRAASLLLRPWHPASRCACSPPLRSRSRSTCSPPSRSSTGATSPLEFAGFDLVEVAPAYDGPGQQTALLAASIAYELLALRAVARR